MYTKASGDEGSDEGESGRSRRVHLAEEGGLAPSQSARGPLGWWVLLHHQHPYSLRCCDCAPSRTRDQAGCCHGPLCRHGSGEARRNIVTEAVKQDGSISLAGSCWTMPTAGRIPTPHGPQSHQLRAKGAEPLGVEAQGCVLSRSAGISRGRPGELYWRLFNDS